MRSAPQCVRAAVSAMEAASGPAAQQRQQQAPRAARTRHCTRRRAVERASGLLWEGRGETRCWERLQTNRTRGGRAE